MAAMHEIDPSPLVFSREGAAVGCLLLPVTPHPCSSLRIFCLSA